MATKTRTLPDQSFGSILKNIRGVMGTTQDQIGKAIGVDDSTISKIEKSSDHITRFMATQIVGFLSQSGAPDDLLNQLRTAAEQHYDEKLESDLDPRLLKWQREYDRRSNAEASKAIAMMQLLLEIIADSEWEAGKLIGSRNWATALEKLKAAEPKRRQLYRGIDLAYNRNWAEASYNVGEFETAIRYWMLLQPLLEDPKSKAENRLAIGGAFRRLARWDDAIEEYREAEKTHPDDACFRASCLRKIIAIYNFQGRLDDAMNLIKDTYEILSPDDVAGLFKLQRHEGWTLSIRGKWEDAIAKFSNAEETLSRRSDSMSEEDKILERVKGARYVADVYAEWPHKADEAVGLYRQGLKDLEDLEGKAGTKFTLLRGMLLLGIAHASIEIPGGLPEAEEQLDKSEQLFSDLKEPLGKYASYYERGRLLSRQRQWHGAESFFRLARQGFADIQALYPLGASLAGLCQTYYDLDNDGSPDAADSLLQLYGTYQTGRIESLPSNRNQLFSIHLSHLQSLAGRTLIRRGEKKEGYRILCTSIGTGLRYNTQVFHERFGELLEVLEDQVSRGDFHDGRELASSYLRFSEDLTPATHLEKSEVAHSRTVIEQKQKEMSALSGKSKA